MRFETTAGILKSALKSLALVVEARNCAPILTTVLFQDKKIRATNLGMNLTVSVPAIRSQGEAAIAFHPLMRLIQFLGNDESVAISVKGECATLSFSNACYELPCLPASDFPDDFTCDGAKQEFSPSTFNKALHACLSSISTEDTRYYLNGICFDKGLAVATTGHLLTNMPCGVEFDERLIVPRQAVDVLASVPGFKSVTQTKRQRGVDETTLLFEGDGVRFTTKLIMGEFPDWRRVVPPKNDIGAKITFERKELLSALKRMMAVFGCSRGQAFNFAFNADGCSISSFDATKIEAREFLPSSEINSFEEELVCCFNCRYLYTVCQDHRQSGTITFSFPTMSGGPIAIESEIVGHQTMLMPMRGLDDKKALASLHYFLRPKHPPKLQAVA